MELRWHARRQRLRVVVCLDERPREGVQVGDLILGDVRVREGRDEVVVNGELEVEVARVYHSYEGVKQELTDVSGVWMMWTGT